MPRLSAQEKAYHLEKMRLRMKRLDASGDGYISREDYELVAERLAKIGQMTAQQAEETKREFLKVADQSNLKPGVKVAVEDAAVSAQKNLFSMSPEERAMAVIASGIIFDLIDSDKDGLIHIKEFKDFLKAYNPDISDEKATECFKILDYNQSNGICRDEFLVSATEFLFGVEESQNAEAFSWLNC